MSDWCTRLLPPSVAGRPWRLRWSSAAAFFLSAGVLLTVSSIGLSAWAEGPAQQPKRAESFHKEDGTKAWVVESVRVDEDRLLMDDEAFLITPRALCYDHAGRRISPAQLPTRGIFDVRYVVRSADERYPQGAKTKVLLELRLLTKPARQGVSP